jgi:hypothetical protein
MARRNQLGQSYRSCPESELSSESGPLRAHNMGGQQMPSPRPQWTTLICGYFSILFYEGGFAVSFACVVRDP